MRTGGHATWGVVLLVAQIVWTCSAYTGPGVPATAYAFPVGQVAFHPASIDLDASVADVSPRFLSFAVDAKGLGGAHPYDFTRPRLRRMAQALAPAYLRLGGTEADVLYYDLSETPVVQPPAGFDRVLTAEIWQQAADFAKHLDVQLLFTLNAGPGPRDASKQWRPDNARTLIAHAVQRHDPVAVWELGNEVNLYWWNYGLFVGGAQLARDAMVLRGLLHELGTKARVAAPASAYWPVLGEIPPQVYADFLAAGAGQAVDVLTWHYYPQQSADCDFATRPAASGVLLQPFTLNEVAQWAAEVEQSRDVYAPHVPIWLGETGNAQCGGAPGISDAFEGGFWWLDQLGLVARRGQPVVIRQTLSGGTYGLIDDTTLRPNPDYFSAVLWKRLMGLRVLAARMQRPVWSRQVRIYAHCTPPAAAEFAPGAVSVVLINLSLERSATVDFAPVAGPAWLYALTAPALSSRRMFLNGSVLKVRKDGTPPAMAPVSVPPTRGHPRVTLAPASYAFVVLPEADAAACR